MYGRWSTVVRLLFFKQKTAYEMRISDWSSDVCSSDLGVAGKSDVEAILHPDQPLHRMRRGRVHADPAVPVQGHEGKRRVDLLADHIEAKRIALGTARPVVHAGTAERIDAPPPAGAPDQVDVAHVSQVFHVLADDLVLGREAWKRGV